MHRTSLHVRSTNSVLHPIIANYNEAFFKSLTNITSVNIKMLDMIFMSKDSQCPILWAFTNRASLLQIKTISNLNLRDILQVILNNLSLNKCTNDYTIITDVSLSLGTAIHL